MSKYHNPKCTISNIANGVLIEVEDSRIECNGVYYHPTVQEALVHMWSELYPNSASSTLEFIKNQIPDRS